MSSTVRFGSGAGTVGVVVTTGGTATTLSVVVWDAANESGSFTWQNETQAADTTVTYVVSGNFVSDQAEVALANMTNGETITADDAVYQGVTTQVNTTYNNQEATNFAVFGSGGVHTISSGSGPDTLESQFVNLTGTAQAFDLLVDIPPSGFVPGLTSTFTVAAHATLDLFLSGTFDFNGVQPIEVIYGYNADDLDMTSLTNDGFVNPGQTLTGTFQNVTDFGPASDAPVTLGTGPDKIVVTLVGRDAYTQYGIALDAAAGSPYIDFGPQETTATGSVSQSITLYGTFTPGASPVVQIRDLQGTTGELFTGGESTEDPNSGVIVQSISYDGNTITPAATITGAGFVQTFTIAPASGGGTISMTRFATPATSGLLATPLETYNWNPSTQLAAFLSAQARGTASIEFMGDSTTAGVGGDPANMQDVAGGFPEQTAYWLNQDGVAAQDANFLGNNNNGGDSQVTFTNGGSYSSAQGIAGEEPVLPNRGATMTFTPTNPIDGDTIETQLFGNYSGAHVQVEVNGNINAGTITVSNSGTWDNDTLTLAQPTTITSVTYTEQTANASGVYIGGTQTGGTSTPAIKVLNSGISGGTAQADNYQQAPGDFGNGSGEVPTTIQLHPSLVLVDYGINDLLYYGDTVSQVIGFIANTVSDLQAAGEDVILVSPTPFNGGSVTTATETGFVQALQTLALRDHVGLIDLNDTYGQTLTALQAAGGISSNPGGVHPSAELYANIGQGIARVIAAAVQAHA